MRKTVSVYGYGRFGKLWAGILAGDFNVKVYSRRGIQPEEVKPGIEIATLEGLHDCDALFYCVAISSLKEVLISSSSLFKPGVLYFDTCSVKVKPAEWMLKHLPEGARIIATHPMFGPDSYPASADPLPMVMCNINANIDAFGEWTGYFNGKKMTVVEMSVDEHDKMVAYSQGITHYVGRVLADLGLEQTSINTLGYTRLLEIIQQTCNDSWQLFCDLQKYNPYTKKMRKELHESLNKIYAILENL